MELFNFVLDNVGVLLALAFVLVNLVPWLSNRYRSRRERERYGHYPPAVRSGRLNYEEYKERRDG